MFSNPDSIHVSMYSISKRVFNKAAVKYPQHKRSLLGLYQALRLSQCQTAEELRALFPSVEAVGDNCWQLDLGLSEPGLRATLELTGSRIYVRHIYEREAELSC